MMGLGSTTVALMLLCSTSAFSPSARRVVGAQASSFSSSAPSLSSINTLPFARFTSRHTVTVVRNAAIDAEMCQSSSSAAASASTTTSSAEMCQHMTQMGPRTIDQAAGAEADIGEVTPCRFSSVVMASLAPALLAFPLPSLAEDAATASASGAPVPFTVPASSATATAIKVKTLSPDTFDPNKFQPICGASDGFYRILQASTKALIGPESYTEYGPLIAGGLLRVRLELCVIESFFSEAVGPFIQQNGVSWILPLHETVETFVAGVIFSLAATFILVGSTKLLTVIATIGDFLIGAPCRLFGGFAFDRACGKPVTLDLGVGPFKTRVIGPKDAPSGSASLDDYSVDASNVGLFGLVVVVISGTVKAFGRVVGLTREALDALDLFVGRYLVLLASIYVGVKFLHFKIFPDFPPGF